jgi:hypothetical protein
LSSARPKSSTGNLVADRFSIVMFVAQPARLAGSEHGRFEVSIRQGSAQDRTFEDVAHQSALHRCFRHAFSRLVLCHGYLSSTLYRSRTKATWLHPA